MHKSFLAAALLACLSGAALAQSPAAPAKIVDTAKGKIFVDAKGMTLYVFDKDQSAKSNCNGPCAQNWPPLLADAAAKPEADWSLVTRDDGVKQWAYKGKPLYAWSKDAKPGDMTGDGFNGIWHVGRP
jgi:predicted lipoprotein with Yx(FWY)xxD motif